MNLKTDKDFLILISKLIKKENLSCKMISGEKQYNKEIKKMVNQTWVSYKNKMKLFDGEVFGLLNYHLDSNNLFYTIQKTSYKYFFGTNSVNSSLFDNKTLMANSLAVCVVVETSDNSILIGLRSDKMGEFPSYWHVPGGNLEYLLPDPAYNTALKELSEETGIKERHIENLICTGLARNNLSYKPEFLFYAKLKLISKELLDLIEEAPDKNEHVQFKLINKQNLLEFIESHKVAPIGKAALYQFLKLIEKEL